MPDSLFVQLGPYLAGTARSGTWIPTFNCAGGNGDLAIVYSTRLGFWSKIGDRVVLDWQISTSTFTYTTAAGGVQILGSPFSAMANCRVRGAFEFSGITKAGFTQFQCASNPNSSILTILASGSAQVLTTLAVTDCPSAGALVWKGSLVIQIDTDIN